MRNKSNLATIGCSVAEWDHSRSVLYGPLESCSAQYQPLWIRRRYLILSHLISSHQRRFYELDPSPFEHRNWLLCCAGSRRHLWHFSCGFGRIQAAMEAWRISPVLSAEEILLFTRVWSDMLVFNVQSCFGSNMDYAFLFLRTSDGFVFVVLL